MGDRDLHLELNLQSSANPNASLGDYAKGLTSSDGAHSPLSVDPIQVALAIKAIQMSVDAMNAQFRRYDRIFEAQA